jgi:hypothetical protein
MTSAAHSLHSPARGALWREALHDPLVWRRTLLIGLPAGLIQVSINQGDHWLAGAITGGVIAKTLLSPAVSCTIAFLSSAFSRRP